MGDEKTLKLLEQLLVAQPENWEARLHLAELHLQRGNAAQAEAVLAAGGALPDEVEAQLLYGRVVGRVDRPRGVAHFQEMIRKDRKCARAYLELARLYRQAGIREEAAKNYGIAAVIDETLEDLEFRRWLEEGGGATRQP